MTCEGTTVKSSALYNSLINSAITRSVPRINFAGAGLSVEVADLFLTSPQIRELSEKILTAFENTGFLILHNHGVNLEYLHGIKMEIEKFLEADRDVKENYLRVNPKTNMYGYTPQKLSEEVFDADKPKDCKETFEFSLWGDDGVPSEKWKFYREQLAQQFSLLFQRVLTLFACALKLKDAKQLTEHVNKLCERNSCENWSAFRAAVYPEIQSGDVVKNQERCGLHCDYGALTFIYKEPFQKGLLSKERKGDFIDVCCIEDGDLIVNAGECLQMLTGDRVRAAPHKVVFSDADQHGKIASAFSFIFFGLFDNEAEIETIEGVGHTNYSKFRFGDYFNMRLTNVFVEGKGLVPELVE